MKKPLINRKQLKEDMQLGLFLMGIGDAIYKARKNMNLGQEKLAAKTGTTQRIISQIENADNYNMGAKMLFKLFKFLKIQMLIDGYDAITGQKINLEDIQILSNNDMAVSQQNFTIANEGFRYYINYHTYTNTSK